MSDHVVAFRYEGEQYERLDKVLVSHLPQFSRTRLQNLIKDGFVLVDGMGASKTGQMVETGCMLQVNIPPPEPSQLIPEPIPLDIIFENDDLLVVNKPAGMVVHPSVGHSTHTLVHAALAHVPKLEGIGGELRPGVVHRLDKNTSGLILLAKNDVTHHWLQDQFRLRKVRKIYLALVDGKPPTPQGRIEAPVGRQTIQRKKMAIVVPRLGREAFTEYRTLESFAQHTLLEVHPITGRTHQIRLHLEFIGCPVVGDTTYGHRRPSLPLVRHFLHASRLTITLPAETQPRTFEAPLPLELLSLLETIRHPMNKTTKYS